MCLAFIQLQQRRAEPRSRLVVRYGLRRLVLHVRCWRGQRHTGMPGLLDERAAEPSTGRLRSRLERTSVLCASDATRQSGTSGLCRRSGCWIAICPSHRVMTVSCRVKRWQAMPKARMYQCHLSKRFHKTITRQWTVLQGRTQCLWHRQ